MSEISTETSTRNLPSARVSMTDSPSLQITTHKLNGSNYLQWSQSVKMFITGRGKLGYLTGALTPPTDDDQAAAFLWETENAMIMAWLINSMEPEIGQVHLFLHTAKAIWDTVAATYSNRGNSAQVFALKTSLKDIRQGNQDVTRFFNQLKNIWQEIDQYSVLDWENKNDSIRYQRLVEKDRVYDFLAGLRPEYDEARERILGREPLQPLMDVFAYIRREESRKEAMNGSRLTASVDNSDLLLILSKQRSQPTTAIAPTADEQTRKLTYGVTIARSPVTRRTPAGNSTASRPPCRNETLISDAPAATSLLAVLTLPTPNQVGSPSPKSSLTGFISSSKQPKLKAQVMSMQIAQ